MRRLHDNDSQKKHAYTCLFTFVDLARTVTQLHSTLQSAKKNLRAA